MNIILINTGPAGPPASAGFLVAQSVSKSLDTGEGTIAVECLRPVSFRSYFLLFLSFSSLFRSFLCSFIVCLFRCLSLSFYLVLIINYFILSTDLPASCSEYTGFKSRSVEQIS